MEYKTSDDIRRLIKARAALQNITLKAAADRLEISRQQLNNMLSKKYISFEDARKIAAAIDCKLIVDIIPGSGKEDI